jgi:hypothetical protein
MDNETKTATNPVALIVSWLLVGLPLAWGLSQTIKKAMTLFH